MNFIAELMKRRNEDNPMIEPVITDLNGNYDAIASAQAKNQMMPLSFKDRLLGRQVATDVQTFNPDSGEAEMQTVVSNRPGLLGDLAQGYNENYNNKFSPTNIGQNKGWATRIGEGLGTIGRIIDSPLGRGLMAYGLNNALGYDNSVVEGLTAAVGRQNAQTADRVYRKQLADMGYSNDDLANINGNITSDLYKNLVNNMYKFRNLDQNSYVKMKSLYDRQLQQGILTPEEYKMNVDALNNQYINSQIQTMQTGNVEESNQTKLLPYRQYALETAPQVALGNLGVAQGNLNLNNKKFNHQVEQDNNKTPTMNKNYWLNNETVRQHLVEYSNTRNAKDRQKMNNWFIRNTGFTGDALLGIN